MNIENSSTYNRAEIIQEGDLVQLVGTGGKNFILKMSPGRRFETHRGIVYHDELIGKPWGSTVLSHLGRTFMLLQPSLADLINEIKRNTQIMYPKDIGFLLVMMGIGPGQHVIEAGTGSGSLTTALAFAVGPQGRVTTCEIRDEMQYLAKKNLANLGLDDRVTFKLRDIAEGFDERNGDALFLDVSNPYDYLPQVREALKPGGFFGCILPTTNQVSKMLIALTRENYSFIEVCEILLRYYKPVPERLRPTDRMVAHTGYLVFARPIRALEGQQGFVDAAVDEEDAYREAGVGQEEDLEVS